MPLETLFSNPNPDVPRNKTLLSRFSNPLAKRSRNTFELAIEPDNPFKIYSPGDVVTGQIVLSVFKGFDVTHLVIALHGYAKVYKHQCTPGEVLPLTEILDHGTGTRGQEYHGNGLASLFQDEQILCGSGFLKKQVYKFGFELQFPSRSLPTTIDFERGSIAYMISVTLTRPTTIAPTTTQYKKVTFQDRIDIEAFYTPKSRAISLEPITRRGKVKKVKQASSINTQDTSGNGQLSRHNTHASDQSHSTAPINPSPSSPAPSENTVATNVSASTQSFHIVEADSSQRKPSPNTSESRSSTTSTSARTITATTEIAQHGALKGDLIPIRVSVTHTKPTRGVVIATLYRQGRIDMHPPIPLARKDNDKSQKLEYEDVYPKSRTGLGGLYFANSSPSSVFRKDLSQSSNLMIVDPRTLTADVRLKVKVPDEAFPTINNVPGGMISFTYHIEVVIDLTGKLGESKFLPSLTSTGPSFTSGVDSGNQVTSEWANSILDTSQLRRTKSVASFELPLIIGTKDSRKNAKARELETIRENEKQGYYTDGKSQYRGDWQQQNPNRYVHGYGYGDHDSNHDYDQGYDGYDGYDGHYYYDEFGHPTIDESWQYYAPDDGFAHAPPIPPPQPEEHLDEKTRLRRQEELLLPSQPPDSIASSSTATAFVPTAPDIEENAPHALATEATIRSTPITISRASARSGDTIIPGPITPPPSLPDEEFSKPTEDKQELERRRLLAQASAPPINDAGEGSSRVVPAPRATAPVINDEEEYISQTLGHEGHDQLPHYQR